MNANSIWIVVFLMFYKTKQGWKLFIIVTKYLKENENKMCIPTKMDVDL